MSALQTRTSASNEARQKAEQRIRAPALILQATGKDPVEAEVHGKVTRFHDCCGIIKMLDMHSLPTKQSQSYSSHDYAIYSFLGIDCVLFSCPYMPGPRTSAILDVHVTRAMQECLRSDGNESIGYCYIRSRPVHSSFARECY